MYVPTERTKQLSFEILPVLSTKLDPSREYRIVFGKRRVMRDLEM